MTNPDPAEALRRRSRRGTARGADRVFADATASGATTATDPGRPGLTERSRLWVAAAAIVLLAGAGVVAAVRSTDEPAPAAGWSDDLRSDEPVDGLGAPYRTSTLGPGVSYRRSPAGWTATVAGPGSSGTLGGAAFSPRSATAFVDGRLVIEAELAVGLDGIGGSDGESGWYEIVVTTASELTDFRRGGLYAHEATSGHWSIGCRFAPSGTTTCQLLDASEAGVFDGARVWQASFFEEAGDTTFGGFENADAGLTISRCAADEVCLDRWRLTLSETGLRIDLNGARYFEQTGLPQLPAGLTEGEVFVHIATMTNRHPDAEQRFAGGSLEIQPG